MNVERRKAPRSMILILLLVSFWLPIAVAAEEQNAVAPRPAPAAAKAASSEDVRSKRPTNSTQPGIEAKGGVEEIVVTAQKRSELVQDVPISLTAFGADNLAFRGISDIGDLALQVPGVTFGKDTGADQHIAIRGVSLEDSSASIEAPIATYVDGVYQTRSFRAPTLGVDLKRIEVLRGPQGTLFGRNATGGAINIVLEDPTEEYT